MSQRQRSTILKLAFRGSFLFLVLAWFVHAKLSAPSVEPPHNPNTFAGKLAQETGVTEAQVIRVLNKLGPAITEELTKNRQVQLPGLGVFRPKITEARFVRDPATGQLRTVPVAKIVEFQPSSDLTKHINTSSR